MNNLDTRQLQTCLGELGFQIMGCLFERLWRWCGSGKEQQHPSKIISQAHDRIGI
jgi:hypothetical protein